MPRCYSQRRLNPFLGIVNVIAIEEGEALCCDGVNWTLFVRGGEGDAARDVGRGLATAAIRFGVWSAREGLRRAPLSHCADEGFAGDVGCELLAVIREKSALLPFALRDRYELWLLDTVFDLPLALIDSACSRVGMRGDVPLHWRADASAEAPFHVPPPLLRNGESPAAAVARIVNRAAGPRLRAQWFYRSESGGGQAIRGIHSDEQLVGRVLPPEAFPEKLLRAHWPDRVEQALVRAYLDWQAPWLLMLQHLSEATRDRLEQAAAARPRLLAEHHALFPKVMDNARVVAARMEAGLRRAAGEEGEGDPPWAALSPSFNE
jgi:hypothetical protein